MAKPVKPNGEIETLTQSDNTLVTETLTRLETAYKTLEARFDRLNEELEETHIRLQQSLSENTQLTAGLNNILENLGSGVIIIDRTGCITFFNRVAAETFGLSPEEVAGHACTEVLGEETSADLCLTLKTGKPVKAREKTLLKPDGRRLSVRATTTCLYNAEGQITGAVETFEDISRLQELTRQASRVNTLTALGEMAATVAHEIRNPLGGIGGFAGLLERDLEINDPRRRLVKKIMEGVASLNRMVTNLLNYTRPLQLNLRPVDVVEVVEDCIDFFEIDAGTRLDEIDLQRSYASAQVLCRTDPEQIQQIVLNLLHNAVQAMPGGGQLQIGISEIDPEQDVRTQLIDACVALSVTDSGIGMSDETRSKLFMPFFTTKEDGNGLGLATAKKVIEAHGGDIFVESAPDQGATFTIFFPK